MSGLIWRNALIIALLSSVIAIAVNSLRPEGLELFAKKEYEIFVPCPEPIKEVQAANESMLKSGSRVLFIDARADSCYAESRIPDARHLEFDYLYPVSDSAVKALASTKVHHIVVYGDGGKPDPGHELARELAGRGIRNIMYAEGGFETLKQVLEK